MLDRIKSDLGYFCDWNVIYEFSQTEHEEIDKVRNLLKEDYNYMDIVLDKNDFDKMEEGLETVTSPFGEEIGPDHDQYSYTKWRILESRLMGAILEKAGLEDESFNEFIQFGYPKKLKDKAKELGKKNFRIQIIFDDVQSRELQTAIDELILSRDFNIMGYASKPLLSYCSYSGIYMESTHDYSHVISDKLSEEIEEKVKKYTINL